MIHLPNCSIGRVNGQRKISKTGEYGLYQTAQVGQVNGQKKEAKLQKMVATTQFRLALETEEERRAKNGLDLILDLDLILIIQGMS